MSDQPTWVFVCMATGPSFYDHTTDTEVDTSCQVKKGHDTEPDSLHLWWNDEGTIRLQWTGEPPFNYGDGSWRDE